jgi:hypothetical protein
LQYTIMLSQRSQRRLSVGIAVSVILQDSQHAITGDNQDISWGGALFVVRDPVVWKSDKLRLVFPWVNGQSFAADAEVIRREPVDDGRIRVAARFTSLSCADQTRLEHFLHLLSSRGNRSEPGDTTPIVHAVELNLTDVEEMRDTLEQIAHGRLSLAACGSYEVDQSILLAMIAPEGKPFIHLRARILAQKVLAGGVHGLQRDMVELEVGFEHPQADLEQLAESTLSQAPQGIAQVHPRCINA